MEKSKDGGFERSKSGRGSAVKNNKNSKSKQKQAGDGAARQLIINLRSSPPKYFIVISQCPQTAETIKWSFLPRRFRKAGPKYLPSTTNPSTPSSMSSITEKIATKINWISRKKHSTKTYLRICLEQRKFHRV